MAHHDKTPSHTSQKCSCKSSCCLCLICSALHRYQGIMNIPSISYDKISYDKTETSVLFPVVFLICLYTLATKNQKVNTNITFTYCYYLQHSHRMNKLYHCISNSIITIPFNNLANIQSSAALRCDPVNY